MAKKTWKSTGGKDPGEYKSLADNLYASYVLLSESFGASYDTWDEKYKKNQKQFCKNVSKSITKFIQDQTFTLTDMRASCELERFDTSKYIDAHVRNAKFPKGNIERNVKNAGIEIETNVTTTVMPNSPGSVSAYGGMLPGAKGRALKQKGWIKNGKNGAELPTLKLRKSGTGQSQGGKLTATGHAYIGRKAQTVPSADTVDINEKDNKVKLLTVEKGTK